MTTLAETKRSP
jgi:pleiotropic regulator 1